LKSNEKQVIDVRSKLLRNIKLVIFNLNLPRYTQTHLSIVAGQHPFPLHPKHSLFSYLIQDDVPPS
jgi:hypothetical protein